MADKEKEMLEDIKDEELREDIEEYMDDEYEEGGYDEHEFSLFDSPIEIATVIFIALFSLLKLWYFVDNIGVFDTPLAILEYFIEMCAQLIPAVILIVAVEIHEKMESLEYNIKLNSFYMAKYQEDLIDRIEGYDEEEEEVEE